MYNKIELGCSKLSLVLGAMESLFYVYLKMSTPACLKSMGIQFSLREIGRSSLKELGWAVNVIKPKK